MRLTKSGSVDRRHLNGDYLSRLALSKRKVAKNVWICTKCKQAKETDQFPPNRKFSEFPDSHCFDCRRASSLIVSRRRAERTKDERLKKSLENKLKRQEELNSQLMVCKRCGQTKTRGEWPREAGRETGHLLKYCCSSSKRSREQVDLDIERQAKVCTICNILKPFSDFSPHSINRDGRQKICKPCRSAKVHSGEWIGNRRREAQIRERSDGSITSEFIKKIFSVEICPCCDGFMERDDKVLDHIIPLKLGGLHSVDNVTVMCRTCNSEKSAYHPSRWLLMLREDASDRMRQHYAKIGLNFDE